MGTQALESILDWMDADGYGTPIGIFHRKDAARVELDTLSRANAELRAALGDLLETERELLRRMHADYPHPVTATEAVHAAQYDYEKAQQRARAALTTTEAKK